MNNFENSVVDTIYNFFMGLLIGIVCLLPFGINPVYGGYLFVALSIGASVYTYRTGKMVFPKWVLFAGLLKEIWIGRLMEKFYPTAEWLQRAQDFSGSVDNNTINLAEIGADPQVLVNNTTYPVPFADRSDVPLQLPLDYYDTEGTVVRNAEVLQLAYPKMDSVIRQHGKALAKFQSAKAAWNFAPTSNATLTPVIATSGITGLASGTLIPFSFDDIINLGQAFDALDLPQDGRVLVLATAHKASLLKQDIKQFKTLTNLAKGEMLMQFGSFDIYVSTQTPTYNKSTGAKNAFGASAASTDIHSSIAFMDTEVMRATGTLDMFSRLRDPEARGDIVGFQQRFVALPIRGKYIAAIIDGFAA